MSYNDDQSLDNSSSDDSLFTRFDEWQEQVVHKNRLVDNIAEDLLLNNLNLNEEGPTPRSGRRYFERQREHGHERLMNDYFVENPTYPPEIFRRRFRMRKPVFLRIMEAVTANDEYFQQRPDAIGRRSLSPLQKCTGAMRVLAYGSSTDAVDEYLRMSAAVTRQSLMIFVEGVISCFGDEYLRRPNEQDMASLLHAGEERGFPGMIGSIDCMHWEWKNCLTAWEGQYGGRSGKPTIILEAVASYDLWIWHAFFGTPGSLNDINVLHRSPVFNDALEGRAPKVSYVVNGSEYNMAYYLTDRIYHSWAAFVKSITSPVIRKHKLFAQHQEGVRKDVERAFGVLQARFAFIRRPCLVWEKNLMAKIMMACIIMHNMIVEDERETYQTYYDPTEFLINDPIDNDQNLQYSTELIASLSAYMTNREQLRNIEAHTALKNDLVEHIWRKFSTTN
ncbi:hypothetical protein CASFOL_018837 [Castilleja foliolosa]|uniref:Nuclease HARBI1 n=1 Tax=Castilleja foliolosa TaxID=1961234 RepID=A0ABD3D2N7_9LAMI